MFNIFLKGLLIGFSIAAAIGPIGLLCISRTLTKGRLSGLITGLGVAVADGVYGSVAAFGITSVSSFLVSHRVELHIIGAIFLAGLGVRTLLRVKKPLSTQIQPSKELSKDFLSAFFLTITNPMTIITFAAIFAGLGLGLSHSYSHVSAVSLVSGVFVGSLLWWVILSLGAGFFSGLMEKGLIKYTNLITGFALIIFGAFSALTAFG